MSTGQKWLADEEERLQFLEDKKKKEKTDSPGAKYRKKMPVAPTVKLSAFERCLNRITHYDTVDSKLVEELLKDYEAACVRKDLVIQYLANWLDEEFCS